MGLDAVERKSNGRRNVKLNTKTSAWLGSRDRIPYGWIPFPKLRSTGQVRRSRPARAWTECACAAGAGEAILRRCLRENQAKADGELARAVK